MRIVASSCSSRPSASRGARGGRSRSAPRAAPGRPRPARGRRRGPRRRGSCSRARSVRSKREPLGEAQRLGHRLGVLGEALGHPPRASRAPSSSCRGGRGSEASSVVAQPHRDEGVLEAGAARVVAVDVAGGDGGDPEPLGEAGEPAVARPVAAPVGPLQLDPEAVAAEGLQQPPRQRRAGRGLAALPGPRQRGRRGRSPRGRRGPRARLDLRQRTEGCGRGALRRRRGCGNGRRSAAGRGCGSRPGVSTSRVRWAPSERVSSAPVIGRTPSPLQACANSIEPQTPSWSVRAKAG